MTAIAERRSAAGYLRTLLVLGRVSNLPTVWSNCLAGWLLAGGGDVGLFVVVCLGATFLYLGGMYLNDAFDAQFDQQHRPERPIPSGAIGAAAVWQWGLSWLGLGVLSFCFLGKTTLALATLLAATIFVYDAIHKIFAISPVLMAACRLWLVLLAASAGYDGVTGLSIWSALVLASYVAGLSFLARKESTQGSVRYWPCLLLAAPLVLALIVNRGPYLMRGALLGIVLGLWTLRSLRFSLWSPQRNIGRSVSGLLAGIVLVDLLAVAGDTPVTGLVFVGLCVLALLFQRFIPAT
jgi:4-hydroxybenzoate polyprenyltransferase